MLPDIHKLNSRAVINIAILDFETMPVKLKINYNWDALRRKTWCKEYIAPFKEKYCYFQVLGAASRVNKLIIDPKV